MSGVPLKAMCSIMCARPVLERGSCAEPVSTMVKKEKTGAPGRRRSTTVSPLGKVLTVTRFSNDAKSWAANGTVSANSNSDQSLGKLRFIVPPQSGVIKPECIVYDVGMEIDAGMEIREAGTSVCRQSEGMIGTRYAQKTLTRLSVTKGPLGTLAAQAFRTNVAPHGSVFGRGPSEVLSEPWVASQGDRHTG